MYGVRGAVTLRTVGDKVSRVYVSTLLFSGWAEVTGIAACDFFPIEITLDEPDSDGHRYKRVCKADIKERI